MCNRDYFVDNIFAVLAGNNICFVGTLHDDIRCAWYAKNISVRIQEIWKQKLQWGVHSIYAFQTTIFRALFPSTALRICLMIDFYAQFGKTRMSTDKQKYSHYRYNKRSSFVIFFANIFTHSERGIIGYQRIEWIVKTTFRHWQNCMIHALENCWFYRVYFHAECIKSW